MHEGSFITSRGRAERRGVGEGEATKLRIACNHTNFSARQGTKGATLPCINVYFRWFWSGSRFMYCGTLHRAPSTVSGHSILLGLLPASGKSWWEIEKNSTIYVYGIYSFSYSRTLALSCKCLNALNRLLMRLTSAAAVWPRLDVVSAAFHPCFNNPQRGRGRACYRCQSFNDLPYLQLPRRVLPLRWRAVRAPLTARKAKKETTVSGLNISVCERGGEREIE